jgi:hypothetical protein
MAREGSSRMPVTRLPVCAVTAVATGHPRTPGAEKVFRSAGIPAPPEESEPAIVQAHGISWLAIPKSVAAFRIQRYYFATSAGVAQTEPGNGFRGHPVRMVRSFWDRSGNIYYSPEKE